MSLAVNFFLIGVVVPAGFNIVMTSKDRARESQRVGLDEKQDLADAEQATLFVINERRRERGLAALCQLPSRMSSEQLAAARAADASGAAAADADPHSGSLIHGVHEGAPPPEEVELMKRCMALAAEARKDLEKLHRGLTHRTAGSIPDPDPAAVLAEARRQGLEV